MSHCTFYLGTHQPQWLSRTRIPLFVSHRRLTGRKTLPKAAGVWALDSGGFTELQMHGAWSLSPADYAASVRRYSAEIGGMAWAAPQDWMCEPVVIAGGRVGPIRFAGTGLSVEEHQRRTVANLLELRELAPEVPWIPVLQGWERADYLRCWERYERAGVDLEREPTVGVGSVCRRQHSDEALAIFQALQPLKLHGFGLKLRGLEKSASLLTSADSMAWSYHARRRPVACGSTTHRNCANCMSFALEWREQAQAVVRGPRQQGLFGALVRADKWGAAA